MATDTMTKMTADDLLVMPHNGYRYELIKGELRQMSPAGSQHGRIAAKIGRHLGNYVEEQRLGETFAAETGYIIDTSPDTVRAPDASFVSNDRLVETENFFPGPPDLAVEVISPNDSYTEVEEKALDWLRAGTQMVIVIDPKKQTATIYRDLDDIRILTSDQIIEGSDIVPGWKLPLSSLF